MKQRLSKGLIAFLAAVMLTVFLSACNLQVWDPPPVPTPKYSITFDLAGGTGQTASMTDLEAGAALTSPPVPVREGYRFEGWLLDGIPFGFDTMPACDITLVAAWNKLYTITFDSAGGGAVSALSACAGDEIQSPIPIYHGFAFRGWYNQNGDRFWFSVMPEADFHLTALWSSGFTVTFETGDPSITIDPIGAVAGAYIYEPPIPVRAEYTFDGWFYNNTPFRFETMPAHDVELTARWVKRTVLPVVHITLLNGNGEVMPISVIDDVYLPQYTLNVVDPRPYHPALVGVSGETGTVGLSAAEVKGRGNGSWKGPKKNYRIKFEKKQSVLGMPASRHWVLMANAWNQPDRTSLRTDIAYGMTREHLTNIEYAARTESVDLFVNNAYHGVYTVSEQIRVDKNRVNIESEYGELDTGYLLNYAGDTHMNGYNGTDWFRLGSSFRRAPAGVSGYNEQAAWFAVRSPDPDDYQEAGLTESEFRAQVSYIKGYMQEVADVLTGLQYGTTGQADVEELMDLPSFVDMYILQELYKNQDAGWGGFYMYKKSTAEGGKLYAGPPWDWDWVTSNTLTTYQNIAVGNGSGVSQVNPFMTHLFQCDWFRAMVKERLEELVEELKAYFHLRYSNEVIENVDYRYAFGRNLNRWTLDVNLAVPPYGNNHFRPPLAQAEAELTWADNMVKTRNWLVNRCDWLNAYFQYS